MVDTHVSTLIFIDDRVYKRKRPVQLDFIDLRDRGERERICHREVELNSRLAPDVYLGVADVVGPDGTPCDHLVVMRRLPDDRRLSSLVTSSGDAAVRGHLRRIATLVAAFHSRAGRGPRIDAAAAAAAVRAAWTANFAVLREFVPEVVEAEQLARLEHLAERNLAGREPLLAARIAAGMVCDGHGDLLADDIFCLDDGPRILDCIEFDDRLRWGDVLADIAFLAMDLERLGRRDLATAFVDAYLEFSGESHPRSLLHHYIAYRAQVRAKVTALRHRQGDAQAAGEARRLLDISFRNLEQGRVVLALVGGLPGSGKSTLSAAVSEALGWVVLSSDELRKDLAGVGRGQPAPAPYGEGIYSEQMTALTYATLVDRAARLLEHGVSVILDATWSRADRRRLAAAAAARSDADVVELRCQAAPPVTAARLGARDRGVAAVSDAGTAVATRMAADAEPWPEADVVDTGGDVADTLCAALQCVARSGLSRPPR